MSRANAPFIEEDRFPADGIRSAKNERTLAHPQFVADLDVAKLARTEDITGPQFIIAELRPISPKTRRAPPHGETSATARAANQFLIARRLAEMLCFEPMADPTCFVFGQRHHKGR
jgi:hypothetical protein